MLKIFSLLVSLLMVTTANAGEYIVKYKPGQFASMMSFYGMSIKDAHAEGSYVKVNIPKENEAQVLAQIYGSGDVEYVVPNSKVYAFTTPPTTEGLKEQWHIAKVQAEAAWAKAGHRGSKKIIVAVIDTGVDYRHPDLSPNAIQGYDFRQNDNDPMDIVGAQNPGHGTHCAGIIGGTGLVDGGIIGISPEVSIMPIRFLGEDGSGDLNNGIKAIDYAIEKGAHIISASWGAAIGRSQAAPLIEAIKRADDKGVIFIAAASNDGKNNDSYEVYPANAGFTNFISVAASGPQDEKPSWSNYGKAKVHLASPGLNIMSTIPNGKYQNMSGTSMATPLVSGLVAFLKSQEPTLTGAQAKAILQKTGAKVSIQTQCDCRVDALAATELIQAKKMYLVPAAGTYEPGSTFKIDAFNGNGGVNFASSNEAILKVDATGTVTAVADGKAIITATDSTGSKAETLEFNVGKTSNGGDDGGGGAPGQCPLDPQMCSILCQIMPSMPWCNQ